MEKIVNLIEADDGSGDLIFPIPDDLMKELNWKEGDTVNINVQDGKILIRKSEK